MQAVEWEFPELNPSNPSQDALQALDFAQTAATDFDSAFELHNPEREDTIPTFHGDEIIISSQPYRLLGFTAEHELRTVRLIIDLQGSFSGHETEARRRFSDRSIDGHYVVKYLQAGIMNSDHSCNAATEMILEAKILTNLAPHPNISQAYGINATGIDSFLIQGRKGFFIITDRIEETLADRIERWRKEDLAKPRDEKAKRSDLNSRLEIAMDIASALVYLHGRKLVYYLRPEKVGFDSRYGRIKLCQFGQARQTEMVSHARSLTKTDCIRQLAYTAPEVFCKGAETTTATDVYAFGMTLWQFVTLQSPFLGMDRANHFQKVVRHNHRPPIDIVEHKWPTEIADLARSCWDPHSRPNMKSAHDTLEMALLFEENEGEEVKKDFRVARRSDSLRDITRGISRSQSAYGDKNGMSSPDKPQRRASHDHNPVSRRKSDIGGQDAKPKRSASKERGSRTGKSSKSPGRIRRKKPIRVAAQDKTLSANNSSAKGGRRGGSLRVSQAAASKISEAFKSSDGKPVRVAMRSQSSDLQNLVGGHKSMPDLFQGSSFDVSPSGLQSAVFDEGLPKVPQTPRAEKSMPKSPRYTMTKSPRSASRSPNGTGSRQRRPNAVKTPQRGTRRSASGYSAASTRSPSESNIEYFSDEDLAEAVGNIIA